MPAIDVRGAHLRYEVIGERGPWVALMPGGRRPLDAVRTLGEKIAAAGYRVLLHDRRNCGASDVIIEGAASESEIWADDLHALLRTPRGVARLRRRRVVGLPHVAASTRVTTRAT